MVVLSLCLMLMGQGPQRVVSLAPSLTEIVCELKLCDRLVGVTEYCLYPERVAKLPKVGGYIDPNIEVVVGLRPDLVLALPEHENAVSQLKHLGIEVASFRNWSLEDLRQSIAAVGRVTRSEAAAASLLDAMATHRKALTRKRNPQPQCLLTLGHEAGGDVVKEVYIVGKNGFLNELIELAGGVNVYPASRPHFPRLDQEALLELNPDVIIELVPLAALPQAEIERKRRAWQRVPHLKAVRAGQFHVIHADHVLQAGPRYLETLRRLVEILDGL